MLMASRACVAGGVLWFLTSAVSAAPEPTEVAAQARQLLTELQNVGAEGRGNEKAARAWRQLSQLDASVLPVLLGAMDDEHELAANWIRGAVDAIAERALTSKGGLPKAELETFLADTSRSPRARRIAYSWLLRVDPGARERWVPRLLHDPSVEFRRDAVERLLGAAKEQDDAQAAAQAAAVSLYREALGGARDEDQVKLIVERLRGYGETVDLPLHYGFLMRWKVVGPFDNSGKRGFNTPYPPEAEIRLDAEYDGKSGKIGWRDYVTEDDYGIVDLNAALVTEKGVAGYAYHEFTSDQERDVELRIGSKNAFKLWVNGELAFERDEYHHGTKLDHYRARARLRAGKNDVLLKVCQNELVKSWTKQWQFQIRVCDSAGTAILSQTRSPLARDADAGDAAPPSNEETAAQGGE